MARGRQRRKQREQEAPVNGGVAEELHEEADAADATLEAPERPFDDPELMKAQADEVFHGDEISAAELIAAIGPLRRSRRHPLIPGIRMFTAMLEEARGGYAADRLSEIEDALGVDFNSLERDGILQLAMAAMDDLGVPDVEYGVQSALEARAEVEEQGEVVAEDHGDDVEAPASHDSTDEGDEEEDHDAPGPDEA